MARDPLTASQKHFRLRGMIVSLVATAILVAFFFAMDPFEPPGPRRLDDTIAVIASFLLLWMGLITAFVHSAIPKEAAIQRQRLAQVLNSMIAGVVLLLPFYGERFIDPVFNFVIIIALTAISLITNWLIWRAGDELMRALMTETWLAGYFVIVTALLVYAAGERLGILSGVTAWGALGFASLVNIICSFVTTYRRGLDRPPTDE